MFTLTIAEASSAPSIEWDQKVLDTSRETESNRRPRDHRLEPTTVSRSTNWAITGAVKTAQAAKSYCICDIIDH